MDEYTYVQFKQIMDDAGYADSGIDQAVKTGHEIILKCGRYFHISENTLREWNSEYTSLEELWTDLRG